MIQCCNDKNRTIIEENNLYELAAFTIIGDREEQQDSFGFSMRENSLIAAVCDGMGGHRGGAAAGKKAVKTLMSELDEKFENLTAGNNHELLYDIFRAADKEIAELCDESGKPMGAGSTALSVMINNHSLNWCSVGDSRLYLIRKKQMICATTDHTLGLLLDNQLRKGLITQNEYNKKIVDKNVLVSFLGVGTLPYIDTNMEPFQLKSNDKIILTSDGLYKYLSDENICSIVSNFNDLSDITDVLNSGVSKSARAIGCQRDNMTMIIIRIK